MLHSGRLGGCAALAALAALVAGCSQPARSELGKSESMPTSAPAAVRTSPAATPTTPSPSPWPLILPVPAARPGQHQTNRRPPAQSPVFHAEMTDLWAAVASGRPDLAMLAFFPLIAYQQVRAIYDPAADWRGRLVVEFKDDVIAAHYLLGKQARHAALVRVIVPESEADWIYPGVCDNLVGYWHVAGARVVYRVNGEEKSFGIAGLISWRGRWYVVHLGGELRTSPGGMVDQPALGSGIPGPPGGC